MKPKIQPPSSFPDIESYIDYIVGNAGPLAAASPLSGASQTYTQGPFRDWTVDQVLRYAQTQGGKAGLKPRSAMGATPPNTAPPNTAPPNTAPPSTAPSSGASSVLPTVAAAASTMGPIGGAIAAGINAMAPAGPPRPQRPQTTPGATFEGKPAAQWFQEAANRQGVANKYAVPTPTPAMSVAPAPAPKVVAAPAAAPAPRPVAAPATPRPRPPIQLAYPPQAPMPPGGAAIADVMRKNGNLPRMQFATPLPTTQPPVAKIATPSQTPQPKPAPAPAMAAKPAPAMPPPAQQAPAQAPVARAATPSPLPRPTRPLPEGRRPSFAGI